MLNKDFFVRIREARSAFVASRRELIKISGDALSASKRAIFALHRDDFRGADELLGKARDGIGAVRDLIKRDPELSNEGSYRAALEEFAEASLYRRFLENGDIGEVNGLEIPDSVYLAGLMDLVGELQRRQVRSATEGRADEVRDMNQVIGQIMEELLAMDLEGYLRTKFDQAKNSMRRSEDVLYEVNLRRQ